MTFHLHKRVYAFAVLGLVGGVYLNAFSEDEKKEGLPVETPQPKSAVDRTHESVSEYIIEKADDLDENLNRLLLPEEMEPNQHFDRFFGDRNLMETNSRARIELGIGVGWSEKDGFEFDHDFSGKLDLPRTEKRLKFVFDNLNEEENSLAAFNRGQRISQRDSLREDEATGSASIQAALGEIFNIRFTADAGLDFKPEPVPDIKLSAGIPWKWGKTEYRFRQRFFWESDDGFGEKTSLKITRFFGDQFYVQSVTAGVWSETSEGVDLGQTLLMRHSFREDSTLGASFGAQAHTEPDTKIDLYLVRFSLQVPIYKNWIYLKIEPGADFDAAYDWEFSPLIFIKTEYYFGRI